MDPLERHPWPGRLERAALRGGAGGRNADRDLDAVCALFDTAARAEERTGGRGALNFLEEVDAQTSPPTPSPGVPSVPTPCAS